MLPSDEIPMQPDVGIYIERLVNIIAYRWSAGRGGETTYEAMSERLPGLSQTDYLLAWDEYQRGMDALGMIASLGKSAPSSPLRWAMVGETPHSPTVKLSFMAKFIDVTGVSREHLLSTEVSWDTHILAAYDAMEQEADRWVSRYGNRDGVVSLVGPVRYPA